MDLFVCMLRVSRCLGVVAILLLNVMEVFSVEEAVCWIDRECSSKEYACCACDPSVHLSIPSIGFLYVFVCWKLSPHLRVGSPYVVSLCDFAYYVVG